MSNYKNYRNPEKWIQRSEIRVKTSPSLLRPPHIESYDYFQYTSTRPINTPLKKETKRHKRSEWFLCIL